jgi:RNA polymerase sigma-B factor
MNLSSRLEEAAAAGAAFTDAELIEQVQSLPSSDPRRDRACEILVARYQPVVRACVHRYRDMSDLADDLMQVGYLGLLKAINNFDPARGERLIAYARPCISGEIKRYFRDRRWQVRVYRPVQELRLQMRAATGELTQQLARTPGTAELAAHLGVSEDEIIEAQLADQVFKSLSLDAPPADGEDGGSLADLIGEDDARIELLLDVTSVQSHWPELDDQAQTLLTMRFYGNMTQDEIGRRLGISQMHVSRLLRRALDYLHRRLTEPPPRRPHPDPSVPSPSPSPSSAAARAEPAAAAGGPAARRG